jgi:CRISPR-associated protein Csd1
MILTEPTRRYDRIAKEGSLDPEGWGPQKISFCLVIDNDGKLTGILDLRDQVGRKLVPRSLNVPKVVKRTNNVAPNLLWDNTGYVLGAQGGKRSERIRQCFDAFCELHQECLRGVHDAGARALLRFLKSWRPENVLALPEWPEMDGTNVVFRLMGDDDFLHNRNIL